MFLNFSYAEGSDTCTQRHASLLISVTVEFKEKCV